MPASDISRLSISGAQRTDSHVRHRAAGIAKDIADREIPMLVQRGLDRDSFRNEYLLIYKKEYEKYYKILLEDQQSIINDPVYIYVPTDNPSARKFLHRHAIAHFSRLNHLIHVRSNCITVARLTYPIDDEEISPDTAEAFLSNFWPGPLDRHDEQLKRKLTNYVGTLMQHDSQRKIRYIIKSNDDNRKIILNLLYELLNRNGTIDAPGITRLLLKPEQTEIQKDEGNKKPLETLQKYLLLGKRSEAIKFAKSKKLWDHAQCLSFLDKYQPPNTGNYHRDGIKLKDDSIVQLNDEYINAVEHGILNTVYRSLLNRILFSDPESENIIKKPNVNNDAYYFTILSANDCEIEFDQTNEAFKLIVAVKQAIMNPALAKVHLISLGYTIFDNYDPADDLSYDRSHISFKQGDTYASRTLTISSIDMLILNEIWEYCLNLAWGTCNPENYNYIINLVPYKLVFASKLLDFGEHEMFAYYLSSIKNALLKVRSLPYAERDPFYDWTTIQGCLDHLSGIWNIFLNSPKAPQQASSLDTLLSPMYNMNLGYDQSQQNFNPTHSLPGPAVQNDYQTDYPDSSQLDYPSLPYQPIGVGASIVAQSFPQPPNYSIPPPLFNQRPIQEEEVNDFNPESEATSPQLEDKNPFEPQSAYNHYSNEPSRRQSHASQSMDMPAFSPPSFGQSGIPNYDRNQKTMTSSSPVNKAKDQGLGDSFNSPYSPINEFDDIPIRREPEIMPENQAHINNTANEIDSMRPANNIYATRSSSSANNNNENKSQPAGDQQPGFLSNILGSAKAFLPKSNSKQMILPDDSKNPYVYDNEKGTWVNTTQPEGAEDANGPPDAPPVMQAAKAPSYSFVKSTKARYPKAQF